MDDNKTVSQLMVFITINNRAGEKLPSEFDCLNQFKKTENYDRTMYDIPIDWDGFKSGVIMSLIKTFGKNAYVALCYLTNSENELVYDLLGMPVSYYDVVHNEIRCRKYIKKEMMIIKLFDSVSITFSARGYCIDIKNAYPVIKVLDVYSIGKESKILPNFFIDQLKLANVDKK